ncbi:MAG TPA: hypothetical protein PKA82_05085 [Pyrinomonadaceae bacterium]|nr:hypothetical protein [Pyrinomonadaceae bacterium]
MKRSFLLLVFTLCLVAGAAFGQNDLANSKLEQQMAPFGLGMAVSVLGEMHDVSMHQAVMTYRQTMPKFADDLAPFFTLQINAEDYVRLDVAQTATNSIRKKADASQKWQMLVGERFGTIYAQIKKNKDKGVKINVSDLQFSLEMITTLSSNPPADVPKNINAMFAEIGELSKSQNLGSDESIEKIVEKVVATLTAIGG